MSEPGDRNSDPTVPPPETPVEASTKTSVEEFLVNANTVMTRAKELLKQGNIRQIVIKTEAGRPLFKLPLTAGVAGVTVGLMLSPFLITALAALGLLAGRLTLVVEKNVD